MIASLHTRTHVSTITELLKVKKKTNKPIKQHKCDVWFIKVIAKKCALAFYKI